MSNATHPSSRTVLFGAFDRHNVGDLLFALIVARLLAPRDCLYAGLAARDMRAWGGEAVHAFGESAALSRDAPLDVIHVGGELLTCDAWEATVMLAPPERVQAVIACENAWRRDPLAWARTQLGVASRAPYVMSKAVYPHVEFGRIAFHAVGGVGLHRRDEAFRAEVFNALKHADVVSVRDRQTQAQLHAQGIDAPLVPDPVVMVAELFGEKIRARVSEDSVNAVLNAFGAGYIALQFDATYGDDATLDLIAREIEKIVAQSGFGIVLFRAGAAPWHDDIDVYRRLAARVPRAPLALFSSLDIWDICALIARCRAYCGSSLHGRIVAMAFARPRVNLVHADENEPTPKQAAYAATWETHDMPATTTVEGLAQAVDQALRSDAALRQRTAADLAARYRRAFEHTI
ncbi:Polysaccharide pyruvyl transferase [Paraburkholderia tropica]|uniref:polysaccharide pyruvyl transferase family protein n=1 Tax=Paraburkholderia tropica TaxID=92647 RepID=UPI001CB3C2AC|nr:polysaccharide pyruvyl transferase family protein [Paraburkholderia tropica]CAG9212503.1 Polysaccharide pyruvyl transferase [Paraburkholderia tropica]